MYDHIEMQYRCTFESTSASQIQWQCYIVKSFYSLKVKSLAKYVTFASKTHFVIKIEYKVTVFTLWARVTAEDLLKTKMTTLKSLIDIYNRSLTKPKIKPWPTEPCERENKIRRYSDATDLQTLSANTPQRLLTFSCEQEKTFYSLTVQLYAKYVLNQSLNEKD